MPPLAERGMRWRVACSNLPPDEQDAALRMDEHERAVAQLAAAMRSVVPVIHRRRDLLRGYWVAVARRFSHCAGFTAKRPARPRPRGRARRLARSPRRTRGPDDAADGSHAADPELRRRRGECGEQPSDRQVVLRLAGADGDYELSESVASFDDFLAVKACWEAVRRIKATATPEDDLPEGG